MPPTTKDPLVSVVIPTYNSSKFLKQCLDSVKEQTYNNIEIIVVDNNSSDDTKKIAKKYTKNVYNQGPERSAQVNYGVTKAKGKYVYKIDSDFLLEKDVVNQAVTKAKEGFDAIVVHNTPDETKSWIAKIRKFEVDMYKYDITHSSARFVEKKVYQEIGGFNEKITAGEDYDFQNKLNRGNYKTGFIDAEAIHLGEPTKIWPHMVKYYQYGKDFVNYYKKNSNNKLTSAVGNLVDQKGDSGKQLGFLRAVYFQNWKKFIQHPILGITFILYNICKYTFGGVGFLVGKLN